MNRNSLIVALIMSAVSLFVGFWFMPKTTGILLGLVSMSSALYIYWRYYLSIKVVGKDEVAIMLFFSEPQPDKRYVSGPVYVPWIPIKWDGYYPWELARIPTRQLPFNFKGIGGADEQRIWSSDRQSLLVDISGYARFPYDEPESLVLMIKSGVPVNEKVLQEWMQIEVISGLRDILATYDHKRVLARSSLDTVRVAAQDFFLRDTGLFARSGICGNDSRSFTLGTGEVIIRVDAINPTQRLSDAMETPVVSEYEADAAVNKAKVEGLLAGGPHDVLMDQWVAKQAENRNVPRETDGSFNKERLAELVAELKKDGSYNEQSRIYKELILADSGNLQVSQVLFGSPGGEPLPANLQFLSIGGEGGAGVLFGGKRGKNSGRKSSKKEKPEDMDDDEIDDDVGWT
ncbi:MAG: hypothetical protein AAB361_01135 [Patescibacteria group bacterium]